VGFGSRLSLIISIELWGIYLIPTPRVCFFLFFGSILLCNQSGDDDSQEDLARFGYKLNMKVNFIYLFLAWLNN
jgi:hypothetical protein